MNNDLRVFPFFSEKEKLDIASTLMLMAQNELAERMKLIDTNNIPVTNDFVLSILSGSPELCGILRCSVATALKQVDWQKCYNLATIDFEKEKAMQAEINSVDNSDLRRENIKFK